MCLAFVLSYDPHASRRFLRSIHQEGDDITVNLSRQISLVWWSSSSSDVDHHVVSDFRFTARFPVNLVKCVFTRISLTELYMLLSPCEVDG